MKNKIDLTVLLPITTLNDSDKILLKNAIESVKVQTLEPMKISFVVREKNVHDYIKKEYGKRCAVIMGLSEESNFSELVNIAMPHIKTKYFSILEYNSEYLPKYFEQVQKYIDSEEYKGKSLYLPTTALMSDKGMMLQFLNESVWAQGVSEVMGCLDFELVKERNLFVLGGGVFDKEAFMECGGFKGDIKIYFAYEFLLRFLNSDYGVMVTPKIGYKHFISEKGSLYSAYRDANIGITEEEATFYLDSAKKEYLFNPNEIQREIKYSPMTTV